ncbi:MAG TPA: hypothetical protein VG125_02805, partial [Pirellulales bacterium]|nr:hypothetical protein [Pirellulales bacterium]
MKLYDCLERIRRFSFGTAIDRPFESGQKSLPKGRRARPTSFRPVGQQLEQRAVLTGTLDAMQQTFIGAELGALDTFGTNLSQDGQLNQELAAVNVSLGNVSQMGSVFTSDLFDAAQSYFAQNPSAATATGLATALSSTTPGNIVTVTGSADASGNATLDVSMDVTKQVTSAALTPGSQPAALGFNITGATVPLSVEMKTSFTISSDQSGNTGLTFNGPLQVIGAVPSGASLHGSVEVGLLPATIGNGAASMDAEVDAVVQGTHLGSTTLESGIGTLATLATPRTSFSASLPLTASLGSYNADANGTPTLTISDANVFDTAQPAVAVNAAMQKSGLLDFTNVDADQLLTELNSVATGLTQLSNSSLLNAPIPLAQGQTLGSLVNVGTALAKQLGLGDDAGSLPASSPLEQVVNGTVVPKFTDLTSLTSELNAALSSAGPQSNVSFAFDPAAGNLTFALNLPFAAPALQTPLDFNLKSGPLTVSSAAQLSLTASGSVQFTLGFNLTPAPIQPPPTAPNAPSNPPSSTPIYVQLATPTNQSAVLTSAASFQISVNGAAAIPVSVAAPSGSTPKDIADAINNALAHATDPATSMPLSSEVVAAVLTGAEVPNTQQNYRQIALNATSASVLSLQIFAAPTDPTVTVTQLAFQNGTSAHAHGAAFLENASLSGNVGLSASNITVAANLGPVGLGATGNVTGRASLKVSLTDPEPAAGQPTSTIPLEHLLDALAKAATDPALLTALVGSPAFNVGATAKLSNLKVQFPGVSLNSNDAITLSVQVVPPDPKAPPNSPKASWSVNATPPTLPADITNLANFSVGDILTELKTLLTKLDFSQISALNTNLPIVNVSPAGLFKFAGGLETDLAGFAGSSSGSLNDLVVNLNAYLSTALNGLNIPTGTNLVSVSYDATSNAFLLDLALPLTSSTTLPLNLGNLSFAHGLIAASGSANLTVTAGATIDVSLGFPLSSAGGAFLDNVPGHVTQISLGLNIDGQIPSLGVNVGPIGITIQQGRVMLDQDAADPTKPATFTLGIPNGQLPLASFGPSDLMPKVTGGANISLPLYSGGTLLGGQPLTIAIPSLTDFSSITVTPDPTTLFSSLLDNLGVMNLLQNPGDFVGGIEGVLNSLQTVLNSGVFSMNLPLIGNKLSQASGFLSPIVGEADKGLKELESLLQRDTVSEVVGDLQDALYLIFGPPQTGANWWTQAPFTGMFSAAGGVTQTIAQQLNMGLGLLPDPPLPSDVVKVEFYDANGKDLGGLSGGALPTMTDAIQFDLQLGSGSNTPTFSVPLDASLGLPGLGLSTSGSIQVSMPWSFNLGFGLSLKDGFYLATPPSAPVTSTSPGTFQIGADVTVSGQLAGTLGFLSVTATDGTPANVPPSQQQHTGISGNFAVSLLDPNNDGKNRLPLNDLLAGPPLSSVLSAAFTATAGIHLHLVTSFGMDANFPSLGADLDIGWNFSSASTSSTNASDDGTLTVEFNNVTLDLGSFFSGFLQPIIQDIGSVIKPVEPVLDDVTMRLPVISDLLGRDTSLLDLAADEGVISQSDAQLFKTVYGVLKDLINTDVSGSGAHVGLDLGSFNLGSQDPRLPLPAGHTFDPENASGAPSLSDIQNAFANEGTAYSQFDASVTSTPGNISFPLLHDPTKAFGLLLGKQVDLMDITLPSLSAAVNYFGQFPIFGPLVATLRGNVNFSVGETIGYDTTGISEFVKDHNTLDLLDGIFVGAGTASPLLTLSGQILAGGGVDLFGVSGGVEGGLKLNATLVLDDPNHTGKLHWS